MTKRTRAWPVWTGEPSSPEPLTRVGVASTDDWPLAWQELGRCAETDPEIFFPENGASAAPARKVCASCPVKVECLNYALDNGEDFGVWGGLTADDRDKLKRDQAAVAA